MSEPLLMVRDVSCVYGDYTVFKHLSLTVNRHAVVAIQGASGCGKTTLLRIIASEEPTNGEVLIDGVVVNQVDPYRRGVGSLYQGANEAFMERTAADMIRFALNKRADIAADTYRNPSLARVVGRVFGSTYATQAEIDKYATMARVSSKNLHQKLRQLSGGERQRAMLARVLAEKPRVLLADEPLSNLDRPLKLQLAAEMRTFFKAHQMTVLYVTHDPEEAALVADHHAVIQFDTLRRP